MVVVEPRPGRMDAGPSRNQVRSTLPCRFPGRSFVHVGRAGSSSATHASPGARMKTFLAVYIGSALEAAGWSALDEEQRQERQQAGIQAWGEWVAANRSSFVDIGAPLGKTKRVSEQGITG